jgi:hypothetical protein
MRADYFLAKYFECSLEQLPSYLFTLGNPLNLVYNPLANIVCLRATTTNQLVKFNHILEETFQDPIICCYPVNFNGVVLWDQPIYVPLKQMEVCDLSFSEISRTILYNF